jgi:hypothetical protein
MSSLDMSGCPRYYTCVRLLHVVTGLFMHNTYIPSTPLGSARPSRCLRCGQRFANVDELQFSALEWAAGTWTCASGIAANGHRKVTCGILIAVSTWLHNLVGSCLLSPWPGPPLQFIRYVVLVLQVDQNLVRIPR